VFKSFKELTGSITDKERTLVVAAANDEHTLEAVFTASKEHNIKFILVGNREKIESLSLCFGETLSDDAIIDGADNTDCAIKAVELIRSGAGDALMKGILDTGTLLRAVLNKDSGVRGSGTLSHLSIVETPGYHKLIGITDGGMIPNPTFEQKADIVRNASEFFQRIGYKLPNIAALCASEFVSPKIQETVDAAELQEMCKKGELGKCLLEGPLSFDIAISKESASIKGFSSEISGETDILMVPNITVGNVLVKCLVYWAGAKMAGCVLGAKVPIVLASRGASAEEKLLSILISTAV